MLSARATEVQPENRETWYLLGRLEYDVKRYEDAYVRFNRMYALDPHGPLRLLPQHDRALLLADGDHGEAGRVMHRAQKCDLRAVKEVGVGRQRMGRGDVPLRHLCGGGQGGDREQRQGEEGTHAAIVANCPTI